MKELIKATAKLLFSALLIIGGVMVAVRSLLEYLEFVNTIPRDYSRGTFALCLMIIAILLFDAIGEIDE